MIGPNTSIQHKSWSFQYLSLFLIFSFIPIKKRNNHLQNPSQQRDKKRNNYNGEQHNFFFKIYIRFVVYISTIWIRIIKISNYIYLYSYPYGYLNITYPHLNFRIYELNMNRM